MVGLRAVLVLILACPTAVAADWPQWLGPKRNASSAEFVQPWREKPAVLWSVPVGPGFSSPVVAGGRVFVHARIADREREEMIALDARTGKELWRTGYDRAAYKSSLNTGPQATPCVAGGKVYGFGITGILSCFDAGSGKLHWQVDTFAKANATLPRFGVCCSPVVIGNRVIVAVAGKETAVVAYDTATGDVAWQALDEPANTSSPLVYAGGGGAVPDVVFMTTLRVVGLSPLDGTVRWEYPLPFHPSGTAPTPVLTGDTLYTSTMDNGTTAVRLPTEGTGPPEKLWQAKDLSGYFSTGVASKDRLFLVTNTLKPIPRADLVCVDPATGAERWKRAAVGYFHFGMIRTANDRLLILDDTGKLKLLDAGAGKYQELCSAPVCGGTLVAPALADGKVYARDGVKLVCVSLAP